MSAPNEIPGAREQETVNQLEALLDDDLHFRDAPAEPDSGDEPGEKRRERDPRTGRFVPSQPDGERDAEQAAGEPRPAAPAAEAGGESEGEGESDADAEAGEEAEEKKAEGQEEESEQGGIETLSDLAAAFEVEEQAFLQHIQVDGPNGERVPLSDVVSAYQKAPEAVRISSEVQQRKQELDKLTEQTRKEHDEKLLELQSLTERMVAKLEQDAQKYSKEELERLKAEDPQRYLIVVDEMRQQREAFQAAHRKLSEEAQRREQKMAEERESWMRSEAQQLAEKLPEWTKDQQLMQREVQEINDFLKSNGFQDEDLEALYDHRYVLIARKAMLYDQLQKRKPELLREKVYSKPKRTLRAQARPGQGAEQARQVEADKKRLAKSGRVEDAAAVFERMI